MYENQPLISTIMPVYNCEMYLSESIESVISQNYKNWELIIIDDGSIDHTSKIIDNYASKDSRIKAFHKKNEGVSMARNFALNRINGKYVTFIDGDDVYHTNRLEKMLRVFEQHPNCDIVFSKHKEFKGELNTDYIIDSKRVEMRDDNILEDIFSDSEKQFMCNIMLKTEIAKKEKFVPLRFAEDFCYIRDCAWHCKHMAVLDEVLYFYRRDNENAMTSHFFLEKYILDYMKLVENNYDFCKKHKLENEFYKRMVAHEYAQNCMRIRKSTSYSNFVCCMNDKEFRKGIKFADGSHCDLFEKMLFFMVKNKIYIPFLFWIW